MSALAEKSPFRISEDILDKYQYSGPSSYDIIGKLLSAAKQAKLNRTPVAQLTNDEQMGLAIAAGVPVDFVEGKMQTAQPIGISRIAGEYYVFTRLE